MSDLNVDYYHVTRVGKTVELGEVLQPGQWGRSMRAIPHQVPKGFDPAWISLLWEVAIETARPAEYPSRLDSLFVFANEDEARWFRTSVRKGGGNICRVRLVNPNTRVYRGHFEMIAMHESKGFIEYMPQLAHAYWHSVPRGKIEVLVEGPLRVEQILT